METRERDHVDGQLSHIRVELAGETERGRATGHDVRDDWDGDWGHVSLRYCERSRSRLTLVNCDDDDENVINGNVDVQKAVTTYGRCTSEWSSSKSCYRCHRVPAVARLDAFREGRPTLKNITHLVVNAKRHVRVLNQLMETQDGVVRLDDGIGNSRRGDDGVSGEHPYKTSRRVQQFNQYSRSAY